MAPLTSLQKQAVQQFVAFTQADKKTAEKVLKTHLWNVQAAVDGYFNSAPQTSGSKSSDSAVNKIFDKYRDDPTNSPDMIQMTGAMNYFRDVGISIEDIGLLLASEILSCPTLGGIDRTGFVAAWSPLAATSTSAQRTHLAAMMVQLSQPAARQQGGLFRRVYKHAFKMACPAGSKSAPLETAAEFWKSLFSLKGMQWVSRNGTEWLPMYQGFLQERWKKAINRDLWDQTLLFALKMMEDDTMSWWSEESAWPGIIDEFVEFAKLRRQDGDKTMG